MTPTALLTRLAVPVLAALTLSACDDPAFNAPRAPIPVVVPQRPAIPPATPVTTPAPATAADPTDLAATDPEPGPTDPAAPAVTGAPVVVIPAQPVAPGTSATAAASTPPGAPATDTAAPPAPGENPLLAQQRAACAREGGRLQSLPSGLVTCIRTTRDAGRACTGASDCEGVCLARSGTCAPITPLYGCHEVLLSPGSRVTQCLE